MLTSHFYIKPRMKPPMGAAGATDENPLSGFCFGFQWYIHVKPRMKPTMGAAGTTGENS
ncbi:hypothetical protein ASZ90_009068 [hydrocarbon metagenome]|uniref:Uncharacterized protein n=1 Tax=hydrocarbon metagenome TaxID=938273 RepID=A0A0W8FJW7_9ZZZZ